MADRIDKLIEDWEPRLRAAFRQSVDNMRNAVQLDRLVEMLERGDIEGAMRAVGLDPLDLRPLDLTIVAAYESGGSAAVAAIPRIFDVDGLRVKIQFNSRNIRAEQWLRNYATTLIRDITEDQRRVVREHLEAGMASGINPRAVALELVGRVNRATGRREGGVIGLTAQQERWVRNYAEELDTASPKALDRALRDRRFDKSVKRSIDTQNALGDDLRRKMIASYRNRALRYRAETLARSEAMTALHESQQEAMRQAIDSGQVQADDVSKTWHSAEDSKVRHTHSILDHQTVAFHLPFHSVSGASLMFPGDPNAPSSERINCRCWMQTRVNFFAKII